MSGLLRFFKVQLYIRSVVEGDNFPVGPTYMLVAPKNRWEFVRWTPAKACMIILPTNSSTVVSQSAGTLVTWAQRSNPIFQDLCAVNSLRNISKLKKIMIKVSSMSGKSTLEECRQRLSGRLRSRYCLLDGFQAMHPGSGSERVLSTHCSGGG